MFTKLFFKPHYSTALVGFTAVVHNLLTGRRSSMFFHVHDITLRNIEAWQDGQLIQTAFPKLQPWQREFLLSGLSRQEQESIGM